MNTQTNSENANASGVGSSGLLARIRGLQDAAFQLMEECEKAGQHVVASNLENAAHELRSAGNCWNQHIHPAG